ncbi:MULTISPECIES: DmsC/YnfH family molybdoenzyme membrane anchor subunit [Sorangium]|uniref:4Fe-4S ferredoxin n=1 Tax=Sorangium cellulosum TaxID=56 RepID=A0A4P2R4F7_SORCE|nr:MULTISPECIES: DmsC/YnfH family molybdoenzyme membrane anchor subunit [Sorangium]AUX37950.1 4Fe-4S ferredoxin [Sorangium cellulosum]WCQ97237.1 ferredoxin [Sorangium sp. Soce836]
MSVAKVSDTHFRLPIVNSPPKIQDSNKNLLQALLADQQKLTAVERFSRLHEEHALPAQSKYYRDLIPLERPKPGQQYAFEVDLDACTACKACVTACHSLNGLDEDEVWRSVGLLHGGTPQAPAQQSVTTACHHCLDPACMSGCPVKAYEKDPVTGIVKHLDDQCIGCQYCILMCPYDAPKFNAERGIVRKCDMCSDRLANDEAPACVQSCPNGAIRITVVDQAQAVQESQTNVFLPGAAAPEITIPTTSYKTKKSLPRNMLPADFYQVSREHSHPPLVAMLVLTQLSVGAFCVSLALNELLGAQATRGFGGHSATFALVFGLAALGASLLHLGRPQFAFRAFLGLKTSWLSREILGFSLFAGAGTLYAASFWVPSMPALAPLSPLGQLQTPLSYAVALSGMLGVFCSVMVYAATQRDHWSGGLTGFKFASTAAVLGSSTVLMVALLLSREHAALLLTGGFRALSGFLCAAMGLKLLVELSMFRHLRKRSHSTLKRSAILMTGELKGATGWRFACGALGGIVLPALSLFSAPNSGVSSEVLMAMAVVAFLFCLAGELLERYLFFAAAPASKMPGGLS